MGFGSNVRTALTELLQRWGFQLSIPFTWNGSSMQPKLQDVFTLERMVFTDQSTIGELSIDGNVVCQTLEDTCRAHKIAGKTAIPAGKYQVVITESQRFKRPLPLLLDVPGFEGVRIHPGNTADDTDGCILVGMKRGENAVYDSRKAFDLVFPEIQKRLEKGKLYIAVLGGTHYEAA